ncbi:hypothetical protein J437_LFUL014561 [Ladona fulva]|uniref:Uncharacterized protein n=1 Tax=Ladona fulva TaxID=123851 RepID=A0A8K0KIR9_LADFU|nr:hypothetical protein J437_LFUL014561 [Ladona fulva]
MREGSRSKRSVHSSKRPQSLTFIVARPFSAKGVHALLVFQEEELRGSGDPRYSHLNEELHVEVTAFAAPAEAHARIAYALAEIRRFLVPVSIRSEINSKPPFLRLKTYLLEYPKTLLPNFFHFGTFSISSNLASQ